MDLSYEDNIIIYMNDKILDIDFNDNNSIQNYFKKLFLKLKNRLNIELSGFYLVKVYKGETGIIMEIKEEESDYYMYDEIDMKIILEETVFLYQLEDVFIDPKILKKAKIINYNNKLYLYTTKLTNIELGYLYEISKLIYKNTENIIKYGRELPLNLI